jgi:hypothetical protein
MVRIMETTNHSLPPRARMLALLLVANGALGFWLLWRTMFDAWSPVAIPSLADKDASVIAFVLIGFGFAAFLLSGVSLFLRRRSTIPFYVAGVAGYIGYLIVAFFMELGEAAWLSFTEHGFTSGDAVFSIAIFAGSGATVGYAVKAVYRYLRELSLSGDLR